MATNNHRFYYAYKWKTVVEHIKESTKGFVLVAASEQTDRLDKALSEVSDRVIGSCDLYRDDTIEKIIRAANSPLNEVLEALQDLKGCEVSGAPKKVSLLVLVDHPYRTRNLHRILTETNLTVISTTERFNKVPVGDDGEFEQEPDARWLYGRPPLPDFENLTDEQHGLYLQDRVNDLSDLIPVYDFSVQGLDFNEMVTTSVVPRLPLVLLNDAPMLWSESITELFAWRGTGKTLWAMALGLHLAAGKSMATFIIPTPQRVLYVEGELPKAQLKERMQHLSQGLTIPAGGFTLVSKATQPRNKSQASVSISTEAGRAAIEAKIEENRATVLILDSIASLAQIDTNKEEHWIPIVEWLVELRCKGMCVIYLQQAGKKGEQRGHSVSEDRIDLAIKLTSAANNSNGASFKMTFTKERQGSLTPLRLTCTQGVWAIDEDLPKPKKVSKKAPKTSRKKEQQIVEALEAGESQASITKRLKVSFRTINKLNKKETNNEDSDDLLNHSNQGETNK